MGVNIGKVVEEINKKTASFQGMKVPVKIIVDDKKNFEISVGTPPVASLILKEAGIDKGSGESGKTRIADISLEQAKEIAKGKFGSDKERFVNQVKGTARSMGITVGQGAVSEEEKKTAKKEKQAAEAAAEEAKESKTKKESEEKQEESKEEEKTAEKKE